MTKAGLRATRNPDADSGSYRFGYTGLVFIKPRAKRTHNYITERFG